MVQTMTCRNVSEISKKNKRICQPKKIGGGISTQKYLKFYKEGVACHESYGLSYYCGNVSLQ